MQGSRRKRAVEVENKHRILSRIYMRTGCNLWDREAWIVEHESRPARGHRDWSVSLLQGPELCKKNTIHFETETCLGFTFTGYSRVKFFPSASITFCFCVSDVHDINHISDISQHRYLHTWRRLGVVWQQRWHAEWRSPELSGCLTVRAPPSLDLFFLVLFYFVMFLYLFSCLVHTLVHCTMNAIRLFSLACL